MIPVRYTEMENTGDGTTFTLTFHCVDGPERDVLHEIMRRRNIRIEALPDGRGIRIFSQPEYGGPKTTQIKLEVD